MSRRALMPSRVGLKHATKFAVCLVFIVQCSVLWAGHNFFRNNSVGGISINPAGVVGQPVKGGRALLKKHLDHDVKSAPVDMSKVVRMRMISLRQLEAAVDDARTKNFGEIPDEMKYLAGLQRIEYVFLYPEQNDIVIAGPGEGWRVDENANVVGITTGRPVMLLDDLLVALRCVNNAREGLGISCSIDPTQEGLRKLNTFLAKQTTFNRSIPKEMERELGPQRITLTGVPEDSHFARVMVAADYRMKRYAMDLEKAPVDGLPSFLDMMIEKKGKLSNMMPRWWLACNYESVARSEDGLAWQLRGPGVKAMTEESLIGSDGSVKATGHKNPIAQMWADSFTEKYDELSGKDIVFGELRNLMDMCVVAALIEKYGMLDRVGCKLPVITANESDLAIRSWNSPKTVASQCSFRKVGRNYLITASGGVQVESWKVAEKTELVDTVRETKSQARTPDGRKWWWN